MSQLRRSGLLVGLILGFAALETNAYIWRHKHDVPVGMQTVLVGVAIALAVASIPLLLNREIPWRRLSDSRDARTVIAILRWLLLADSALIVVSWAWLFWMASRIGSTLHG